MSKKQDSNQLKIPLMTKLEGGSVAEEVEVPMDFNSPIEQRFFEQALLQVVPEDKRGDPKVKQSIGAIYSSYYGVVNATKALAIAVYEFCNLTGCEYGVVGTALSKGIQKQLSKSYISKLYHAGRALAMTPIARKITDIDKLANVGKLDVSEIQSSLTEKSGQLMLGTKYMTLMSRDDVRGELATLHPHRFETPKPKQWDIKAFRANVENVISLNTSNNLSTLLKPVLNELDIMIKTIEASKLEQKEAAKLARSKDHEARATA